MLLILLLEKNVIWLISRDAYGSLHGTLILHVSVIYFSKVWQPISEQLLFNYTLLVYLSMLSQLNSLYRVDFESWF
jgi:hypothetical protein